MYGKGFSRNDSDLAVQAVQLDRNSRRGADSGTRDVLVPSWFNNPMRVFEARISYRLVQHGTRVYLHTPAQVVEYLAAAFEDNPVQEHFYAIYLNRRNCPLGRQLITVGTLNSTLVAPREVFRGAILANASALIVAHNHPSGDPSPSTADISVTRMLKEASKIIDIELIDHVVVGAPDADPLGKGYYSFREAGHC